MIIRVQTKRALAVPLILLLCAAGCASWFKKKDDFSDLNDLAALAEASKNRKPKLPETVATAPLPPNAKIDPIVRSQRDIGLTAVVEGNKLRVMILNKTQNTLLIGPKNLAVLPSGSHDLIRIKDPDPGFPPAKLAPGNEQVAVISTRGLGDLTSGSKLIFNHPECEPAMTRITWNSPPQSSSSSPANAGK